MRSITPVSVDIDIVKIFDEASLQQAITLHLTALASRIGAQDRLYPYQDRLYPYIEAYTKGYFAWVIAADLNLGEETRALRSSINDLKADLARQLEDEDTIPRDPFNEPLFFRQIRESLQPLLRQWRERRLLRAIPAISLLAWKALDVATFTEKYNVFLYTQRCLVATQKKLDWLTVTQARLQDPIRFKAAFYVSSLDDLESPRLILTAKDRVEGYTLHNIVSESKRFPGEISAFPVYDGEVRFEITRNDWNDLDHYLATLHACCQDLGARSGAELGEYICTMRKSLREIIKTEEERKQNTALRPLITDRALAHLKTLSGDRIVLLPEQLALSLTALSRGGIRSLFEERVLQQSASALTPTPTEVAAPASARVSLLATALQRFWLAATSRSVFTLSSALAFPPPKRREVLPWLGNRDSAMDFINNNDDAILRFAAFLRVNGYMEAFWHAGEIPLYSINDFLYENHDLRDLCQAHFQRDATARRFSLLLPSGRFGSGDNMRFFLFLSRCWHLLPLLLQEGRTSVATPSESSPSANPYAVFSSQPSVESRQVSGQEEREGIDMADSAVVASATQRRL